MCEEIRVESSQFDEIVKNIKDSNLSRNKLPKLIIGTGLSATYKVPGMGPLAMELSRVLSKTFCVNQKVSVIYLYETIFGVSI